MIKIVQIQENKILCLNEKDTTPKIMEIEESSDHEEEMTYEDIMF